MWPRTADALTEPEYLKAAFGLVGRRVSGLRKSSPILLAIKNNNVYTWLHGADVSETPASPSMFSGKKLKQLRNIKQGAARVRTDMGVPAGQGWQVEKTELEQEQR